MSALYAMWHLDEITGVIAHDSSGNNRNLDVYYYQGIFNEWWIQGKVNNGFLGYVYYDHYAVLRAPNSDIGDFEYSDPWTIGCWVDTSKKGMLGTGTLKKHNGAGSGYQIYMCGFQVMINIYENTDEYQRQKKIQVYYHYPTLEPAGWHYFAVTYDGSDKAAGIELYIDGIKQAEWMKNKYVFYDSLTGNTIRNSDPFSSSVGSCDEISVYIG